MCTARGGVIAADCVAGRGRWYCCPHPLSCTVCHGLARSVRSESGRSLLELVCTACSVQLTVAIRRRARCKHFILEGGAFTQRAALPVGESSCRFLFVLRPEAESQTAALAIGGRSTCGTLILGAQIALTKCYALGRGVARSCLNFVLQGCAWASANRIRLRSASLNRVCTR